MRLVHAGSLCLLTTFIVRYEHETDWRRGAILTKKKAVSMREHLTQFAKGWSDLRWDDFAVRLGDVIYILEHGNVNWDRPRLPLAQLTQSVNTALYELDMALSLAIDKHQFVMVDEKKRHLVEEDDLFGKPVARKFPSAKDDIKEACQCMAVDLYTAAVFYLMRVAERGMRALAVHLKVKVQKTKKGKPAILCKKCGTVVSDAIPSKSKLIPLDYAMWEQVLQALEARIKTLKGKSKGPQRTADHQFYYHLWFELNAFKDLWRNEVSHCRRPFGEPEANQVFPHVKAFMQRLADKGLKETN